MDLGSRVLAPYVPNKPSARIGTNMVLSRDYNFMTRTSMACHHASGIVALVKFSHPQWSVVALRYALITTSNPMDNTHNHIRDSTYPS
ncbi:hypothetical protein RYX36_033994 [Vicia faba]